MKAAGYKNPDLSFELGLALINCGATKDGIANLEEFVKTGPAGPNRNRANEVLERTLAKEAETKKNAAKRAAAPNATAPPSPSPTASPSPAPQLKLPFTLSIVSGLGYNDNVITIAKNAALPAGISQKNSFYNESGLSLGRDWPLSHQSGDVLLADKFSLL